MTRRDALKLMMAAIPAIKSTSLLAAPRNGPAIAEGRFKGTRESLAAYECPKWFHDAKFGIWAHWGPQSAIGYGDWYPRNMYIQGHKQYKHHLEHYGHPSKVGYKDLIPIWHADGFDPDHLIRLYKKAGAQYFMSMGVHVDNFDLWNSKHTRWNAVNMGPKKDIVTLFRRAVRNHGLKFGVSDHLWMSYKWFSTSHGTDLEGPLAGVPYDGADLRYSDLYGTCPKVYRKLPWDEDGIPESWMRHWFDRIKDLVDQHDPDVIYQDGQIPFGEWGLNLVAHYYNRNVERLGGRLEAVYTSKREEDSENGVCVFDKERGVVDGIWPRPWQICTCIGTWHYNTEATYKTPKRVIDMLVDVVSRNGNLLLNFPLPNSGVLDDREMVILDEITQWMAINGEGIFATRPWKTFGEGPGIVKPDPKQKYREMSRIDFTAEDVRFTTKGDALYAYFFGWPEKEIVIPALGTSRDYVKGRIEHLEMLGHGGKLKWWQHDPDGLKLELPAEPPCKHAYALKIQGLEVA